MCARLLEQIRVDPVEQDLRPGGEVDHRELLGRYLILTAQVLHEGIPPCAEGLALRRASVDRPVSPPPEVKDYPAVNRDAVREMHRQVGDLVVDETGLAVRGLLIRHLVLPEGLAGSREVLRFISNEISPHSYINLMDQYRPAYQAREHPPLDRAVSLVEYGDAAAEARTAGLDRVLSTPHHRLL